MIGELIGGFIGQWFGDRYTDRKAARLQKESRAECGLRVISGSHRGLSQKWRHETMRLSQGRIQLYGSTQVKVRSIDRESLREPTSKEAWSINRRMRLVRIETESATLEWAVFAGQVDWAIETLTRAGQRVGPPPGRSVFPEHLVPRPSGLAVRVEIHAASVWEG